MKVLVINAGSSSHKLSFFDLQDEEPIEPVWQGTIEWGQEQSTLSVKTSLGNDLKRLLPDRDVKTGLRELLATLWEGETKVIENSHSIDRVGHRVVHGGPHFERPMRVNPEVKAEIKKWSIFAPLHNPASLEGIEYIEKTYPFLPQIVCFDTAFHTTMPEKIKTYPIPAKWRQQGIQRYGFHGISHQYCAERLTKIIRPGLKIINCHLGNGCSLCAIQEGKSWETTMGLTPLEGLMMGTRSGSIDPSIPVYLIQNDHMSPKDVNLALNFESGLKGISGLSDMRELMAQQEMPASQLAIEMFVHRLKTAIGALVVSLEGVDVINFTAGIGENSAAIRAKTCEGLTCLGIQLDLEKNNQCQPDQSISHSKSNAQIWVIHTREEWMIAKACLNLN